MKTHLFSAGLSVTILREPLTPSKIIGEIFVVLGVLCISLCKVIWK